MNVSFKSDVFTNFDYNGSKYFMEENPVNEQAAEEIKEIKNPLKDELNKDVFKVSKKGEPKVPVLRIWFNRLTQDQIDEINRTGKLPKNIKVRPKEVGTGYYMYHNIFNMYNGTQTMPEGYELRRNRLGFTRLVPKDTEGFWLPKKAEA